LHFRPGFKLDVPSPTFAVTLGAAAEYLVYTGLNSSTASSLNRLQAEANLDVGVLRGSVVSLDLGDHFTRSNQTTDLGSPVGLLSLYNDARAAVTIAPGGGSLTVSPGYHFVIESFSPLQEIAGQTTSVPSNLDYLEHRITLENRWRFLPKTAVLLDGEYNIRAYDGSGSTNISFFKATTGVTGLITPHLSTTLRAGWAMDVTTHSFSSVVGQLEGTYQPTELAQLRLGFLRNFEPVSAPYVSYEDDRAYLQGRMTLISRLTLNAQLSFDHLGFVATTADAGRTDAVFSVSAGADFEVTRWLIISAGGNFVYRDAEPGGAAALTASEVSALSVPDTQVLLRLTFTY
jgi:hypothetical protein